MKIINKPTASIEQVYAWLETKKPHPLAKAMVPIFYDKCVKEGIDPVVVITQAMKETGYFKFTGVLKPNFCNTCGLKGNKGGGDLDPKAHTRFDYWEDGIQAHIDHIALYAGQVGFPRYGTNCPEAQKDQYKENGTTLDPRHFPYLLGKCPNVEDLSGNWAPGTTYGTDVIKMCTDVANTKVQEVIPTVGECVECPEYKKDIKMLEEAISERDMKISCLDTQIFELLQTLEEQKPMIDDYTVLKSILRNIME